MVYNLNMAYKRKKYFIAAKSFTVPAQSYFASQIEAS